MKTAVVATVVVLAAATLCGQEPRVVRGPLERRAVSGSFQPFFEALVREQASPAWIGYSVPAVAGHRAGCCGNGESSAAAGPCYLEDRPATTVSENRPVKLEGDTEVLVLLRVENRQVGRIAVFSPDCQLDVGGLRFVSVSGVRAADSVQMLMTFARGSVSADRVARAAVTAIALHGDPAADTALEQLVATPQPIETRNQAAFWLGQARGERGYQILRAAIDRDKDPAFRRQATFGLSRSAAPGALDTLFRMAKADPDASVRGQALFWLAQKAGKQAVTAITDAVENDPESQVRERAVFALSQLPKDESVPLLITLARTNRDAKVRQRAMFWLGQSKDPRAVAFFEEVLKPK